ncbi:MAG: glycosyltransferase family 2 protein [Roseburia sp.]|nr:glycosyltransferase family 2 protein [Roseburia sp.]
MKKTITVVIPTYNEEQNIQAVYDRVSGIFSSELINYDMEILFIDNASTDSSRLLIEELCVKDRRVQAIFNATNFGFSRSSYYGLSQAEGDCAVMLYADMQDPPEVIPQFVKKWEEGYKVITGIKSRSRENPLMYAIRGLYYKILSKISETEHIQQFDGFGLYDASFVRLLRKMKDPMPYLRGLVAEYGCKRTEVEYTQEKRTAGKTSFNFARYYDVAMLGLTSSTKAIMRMATFLGLVMAGICFLIAIITLILKLVDWNYYDVGTAAIIVGIFFVGAVQIFFLGFLGEYILNINIRVMQHPIVVEERRINLKRSGNDEV